MNLVAHLVLSFHQEEIMVGNWLGEVVKGKDFENYSPEISKGILLHRAIDTFTDAHEITKKASALFHHSQHKYSPIIVDLVFDFCLIKNWNQFYQKSDFQTFKKEHYAILAKRMKEFPPKTQEFTKALLKYDWFENYASIKGLEEVLKQMSRRSKYPNNMGIASKDIYLHENELEELFLEFYPLLEKHCKEFLNKNYAKF